MEPSQELAQRAKEIEQLTTNFCKEYLTDQYAKLCVKLIDRVLHSESANVLMTGRAYTVAGGVLQVIAANNFLFRSQIYPVSADTIAEFLGTSVGTIGVKARLIRKAANVEPDYDPEFATYDALENNVAVKLRTYFNVYDKPQSDF